MIWRQYKFFKIFLHHSTELTPILATRSSLGHAITILSADYFFIFFQGYPSCANTFLLFVALANRMENGMLCVVFITMFSQRIILVSVDHLCKNYQDVINTLHFDLTTRALALAKDVLTFCHTDYTP